MKWFPFCLHIHMCVCFANISDYSKHKQTLTTIHSGYSKANPKNYNIYITCFTTYPKITVNIREKLSQNIMSSLSNLTIVIQTHFAVVG